MLVIGRWISGYRDYIDISRVYLFSDVEKNLLHSIWSLTRLIVRY